jgi:hypothetical protein
VIFLASGLGVPRSAVCTEVPEHNMRESRFVAASQASGRSFSIDGRDPFIEADRWPLGLRG